MYSEQTPEQEADLVTPKLTVIGKIQPYFSGESAPNTSTPDGSEALNELGDALSNSFDLQQAVEVVTTADGGVCLVNQRKEDPIVEVTLHTLSAEDLDMDNSSQEDEEYTGYR